MHDTLLVLYTVIAVTVVRGAVLVTSSELHGIGSKESNQSLHQMHVIDTGLVEEFPVVVRRAAKERPISSVTAEENELAYTENPAGCFQNKNKIEWSKFNGVWPLEDFRFMLENRKGLIYNTRTASKDLELSRQLNVPYCPEPLNEDVLSLMEGVSSVWNLKEALTGLDEKKPIIMAFAELTVGHNYRLLQVMNLICGFQRLGIDKQILVFTMSGSSAIFLKKLYPWLTVVQNDKLTKSISNAGNRLNVGGNRIAKLVMAKMLLDLDREVIMTDLDAHWLLDPSKYLQALTTPSGDLVDLAAMTDGCWLDLNSGFIYYRPTSRTKELLRMAISTQKFVGDHPTQHGTKIALMADNDQYLFNCAFARSAIAGLKYVALPSKKIGRDTWFKFGDMDMKECHASATFGFVGAHANEPAPMIWHTSGFSGTYELEFDRFAALGFIDIDASTGQCAAGLRNSTEEFHSSSQKLSRLCKTGPDGIIVSNCHGSCSKNIEPLHARILMSQFKSMPLSLV